MIAMVLFGVVSAFVTATGNSTFHPAPYGVHSVIAGLIFGVGMVITGGCASGSLYKAGEGNATAALVILSISVSQAIFVDIGGWANNLVPYSWHQSAMAKGLPAAINVGDGWMDQYLAGYVWDQPVLLFSQWLGSRHPFRGGLRGRRAGWHRAAGVGAAGRGLFHLVPQRLSAQAGRGAPADRGAACRSSPATGA